MNIYLLNGTQTGFLPAHFLVQQLPIKGLIGLENNEINSNLNEYYDYSSFCRDSQIDYIPLRSYSMADEKDNAILLALDIDILVSVSWQRLVPDWLIEHCRIGVVGSHGSPLGISQGRGRSPQNWALLLGCKTFSYSIFWIDPGVDSGKIIDTCSFSYTEADDIMTSYTKAGLAMVHMLVKNYHNGHLQQHFGKAQKDAEAFYLPQRTREDGLIDWTQSAHLNYDFVRAITKPYPGAYTLLSGQAITIWQGKYIDWDGLALENTVPGEVLLMYPGGEFLVQCGIGLFLVTAWDAENVAVKQGIRFTSANFEGQLQAIVARHTAKYNSPVSPLITERLYLSPTGEQK